jgi:hypothetical protein
LDLTDVLADVCAAVHFVIPTVALHGGSVAVVGLVGERQPANPAAEALLVEQQVLDVGLVLGEHLAVTPVSKIF